MFTSHILEEQVQSYDDYTFNNDHKWNDNKQLSWESCDMQANLFRISFFSIAVMVTIVGFTKQLVVTASCQPFIAVIRWNHPQWCTGWRDLLHWITICTWLCQALWMLTFISVFKLFQETIKSWRSPGWSIANKWITIFFLLLHNLRGNKFPIFSFLRFHHLRTSFIYLDANGGEYIHVHHGYYMYFCNTW